MTANAQTMLELIGTYDEYVKLLADSEGSLLGIASVHGYRCPDELITRGKELRDKIAHLKSRSAAPAQAPKTVSDVDWKRALDCAQSIMETYIGRRHISTEAGRKVALDDAMQHAFGLLSLRRAPAQASDVVWTHGKRQAMAEVVHKARFKEREPNPFEEEDRNGRAYCFRIADAVLASLPAQPPQDTESASAAARASSDATPRSPASAAMSQSAGVDTVVPVDGVTHEQVEEFGDRIKARDAQIFELERQLRREMDDE